MTSVFMVTDGWYSDYRVLGIYSTRELAERAREMYVAGNEVDEIELNTMPDAPPGLFAWLVEMDFNGNTCRCQRMSCENHRPRAYIYKSSGRPTGTMTAYVWAESNEHAVKIANEWRVRIVATNQWFLGKSLTPGEHF